MLNNYNYLVFLLYCFTNCYEAWLELHVYFILTNYVVIHTTMISMMTDLHIPRCAKSNINVFISVYI